MRNFAAPTRRLIWGALLALALLGSLQLLPSRPAPPTDVCLVAPPTPFDARTGLGLLAARPVPADARCPVCGMYPARSRDWAAQVIFKDNGDTQFFDSPLSLFIYLQEVGRYTRGRSAAEIGAVYVSDANNGAWIKAETAVYVQGSSALGPMRAGNLPAFADKARAEAFAAQRGGRLLRFEQIDAQLLAGLAPNQPHRH
ncbi:nitrous oxide reductase accessory protein NosL [Roseateles sp.]|uniref:nitrous oxide reductase accessory protein NosL n=1 Tax=Roseateles sp. TaxID=1971397 RepID=UPI00286C2405|nr:nitrous oxide reductase accessory protein NosL [Roseateles sp.]